MVEQQINFKINLSERTTMKSLSKRYSVPFLAVAIASLAGCQGAPCGSYGVCGTNYGQFSQPYGQVPAAGVPAPGVVTPPPQLQPGATIQPGVQYAPGTVPVAPQQLQPGNIYGG